MALILGVATLIDQLLLRRSVRSIRIQEKKLLEEEQDENGDSASDLEDGRHSHELRPMAGAAQNV